MKLTAFIAALLLGTTAMAQTAAPAAPAPAPAPAAEAPKPAAEAPKPAAPAVTFALKGFVSMTSSLEDGNFSLYPGQGSLAASAEPLGDKNALVFDVRQSRFNFSVKGPQVMFGATPTAVMELDFFQGFGAGNFGNASLLNRLRLAYSELNWGDHKVQFGQQNDLIFAMAPTSLSHIAFPLAFFTGNLGWRRPGIFGFHNIAVNPDVKVEAAWEIARSTWADGAAAAGANVPDPAALTTGSQSNGHTRGEASALPAVEGRVTVAYQKLFSAFVAAHYNQVDLTGQGNVGAGPGKVNAAVTNIEVISYHAGAKLTYAGATLQGSWFTGKNTAPLLGNFAEFKLGPKGEDVNATGYWVQGGYNLTKEFSAWFFYGNQKPKESEAKAAGLTKLENTTMNASAIYRDGGYAVGVEWINFKTKLNAANFPEAKANQYMLTANYFF